MYLCLFEDDRIDSFLPLTYTRAVYDLRLGMRTLLETTRDAFDPAGTLLHVRPYLAEVVGRENDLLTNRIPEGLDVLFVNGRFLAEEGPVLDRLRAATRDEARVFVQGDDVVAAWVPGASSRFVAAEAVTRSAFDGLPEERLEGARLVSRLWELIYEMPEALGRDFELRARGYRVLDRPGADIREGARLVEPERVFVAPGATIRPGAILSAEEGPIIVDADAEVHEYAVVTGPAYVGPHSIVKVGSYVSESAIGTRSKVAGEVHTSIIHSLSNKAHPGHLGHSYLGRWCNIGADSNNSNLKNDYGSVAIFDYAAGDFVDTGRQFAGLFMGDHAKCGIDTMFNTGTVVGVFANVFGAGFQPRHIPSFMWGGIDIGFSEYRLDKAFDVATAVMARRDVALTDADREVLTHVFEVTRGQKVVK